jgi:hypothetical protein|tara:strand:- start:4979 stop:5422 length:444 start_codon:yes stop_codon:yes gene_type:complete
VSLLAMDILGATDRVSVNIPSTLMQIIAPDEMRGWISAVSSLFKGASNEIGELRAGTMAALIDAVPAVLVGGIGTLIVMAVYWRAFLQLAKVERFNQDRWPCCLCARSIQRFYSINCKLALLLRQSNYSLIKTPLTKTTGLIPGIDH